MSPRRADPLKVEPYRPGKCEFPTDGKPCRNLASVWTSRARLPNGREFSGSVCDKHWLIVHPPIVNPSERQELIDDETFPGGLQGARR